MEFWFLLSSFYHLRRLVRGLELDDGECVPAGARRRWPNRYVVPEAMSSDAKSARSERQHATAKEKKERELREKERELREKKRKQEHEEKKATKKKKLEEEG